MKWNNLNDLITEQNPQSVTLCVAESWKILLGDRLTLRTSGALGVKNSTQPLNDTASSRIVGS